ncbi:MAG: hypothetical protein IMZ64_07445 [Bacteroidetes bacterium]|nr:hypothetical protein [Bacteroidota bacterium]
MKKLILSLLLVVMMANLNAQQDTTIYSSSSFFLDSFVMVDTNISVGAPPYFLGDTTGLDFHSSGIFSGALDKNISIGTGYHTNNALEFALQNSVPVITIDRDSAKVMMYGTELLTFKLLMKYKQECYNDSSMIRVNINPDRNTVSEDGHSITLAYYAPVWGNKWVRKQPTFSDFLNWLETQYK